MIGVTLEEFPYNFNMEIQEKNGYFESWEGICNDLLEFFSKELNFTFDLKPSSDGTWNGLIDDVKNGKADFGKTSIPLILQYFLLKF